METVTILADQSLSNFLEFISCNNKKKWEKKTINQNQMNINSKICDTSVSTKITHYNHINDLPKEP